MTGGAMGAVTVPYWVKNKRLKLSELTPADMAQVYQTGRARDLLTIGDLTAPVPLVGTIAGTAFNTAVTYRLVHIDEQGLVFQLACHEDGVEIALTDAQYSVYLASNVDGICMNRCNQVGSNPPDSALHAQGPNEGGWKNCYARNTVMPQILAALPADLQALIAESLIWTDNVGSGSKLITGLTPTDDKVFLPGEVEIFGRFRYANEYTMLYQTWWDWYKAGNVPKSFRIHAPTNVAWCLMRDPGRTYYHVFSQVDERGAPNPSPASKGSGMKYAFRIA